MKLTLRSLAALLAYPSDELKAHVAELREALIGERLLVNADRARLEPLLTSLEEEELLDLQASYSELFDRSRSLSLHLFERYAKNKSIRAPDYNVYLFWELAATSDAGTPLR